MQEIIGTIRYLNCTIRYLTCTIRYLSSGGNESCQFLPARFVTSLNEVTNRAVEVTNRAVEVTNRAVEVTNRANYFLHDSLLHEVTNRACRAEGYDPNFSSFF